MKLQEFFKDNPKVALGFSGGVDSSYLLYAAIQSGADIQAYYVKTAFQPDFELGDAQCLAKQLGVQMTVIEADILTHKAVTDNPVDRCYHCKKVIFGTIKQRALSDGYPTLIDGSNASDDADERPGMKSLAELSVKSPLRECGLTKREIRRLSQEAGLFTWDKPAYACLATRIPTSRPITADLLERIERAEEALFFLGFTGFRVRVLDGAAKLQFPGDQIEAAVANRDRLLTSIKPYFSPVLLDLEGR